MESPEQLWNPFSRSMEYGCVISTFIDLFVVAVDIRPGRVLSFASSAGGAGDVPAGIAVDEQSAGCGSGRNRFRVQRSDAQLPHVGQQHGRVGVDAVGDPGR